MISQSVFAIRIGIKQLPLALRLLRYAHTHQPLLHQRHHMPADCIGDGGEA